MHNRLMLIKQRFFVIIPELINFSSRMAMWGFSVLVLCLLLPGNQAVVGDGAKCARSRSAPRLRGKAREEQAPDCTEDDGEDQPRAVAYMRTSSPENAREERDSKDRQWRSISDYAKRNSISVVESFYDGAVSGMAEIQDRPGFAALLDFALEKSITLILLDEASRFEPVNRTMHWWLGCCIELASRR